MKQKADFIGRNLISADYHQQYPAMNPNGYCGIGGYAVAYSPKELAER
jgi:peptide methionine sulfoxide reductase MsrA